MGAGGRSIPEALAAVVGPTGRVLATDIDPAWLKAGDGYEVRRHDVAADPAPEPGTFDLVHARLVLVHVPDRARAFALGMTDTAMVTASRVAAAAAPWLAGALGPRPFFALLGVAMLVLLASRRRATAPVRSDRRRPAMMHL